MNYLLWILQILLMALFLFAGGSKLSMPADLLAEFSAPLPLILVQLVSFLEILGALGLVLPAVLRIRPELIPLAAAGLTVIMMGATAMTVVTMGPAMASIPLIVGFLTAFVSYGRRRPSPQVGGSDTSR
jgi:uncharacterized membrane protein YphA (DoxX/SURF4 family)